VPDGKLLLEQVREGQSSLELEQKERKTGGRNTNRVKEERRRHRVSPERACPCVCVCGTGYLADCVYGQIYL